MNTIKRAAAGVVLAGSLFISGGLATTASAQTTQDGLVNVNIGDINILQDVNIGVAAQVAAQLCGLKVGPVAVLGQAVDRSGDMETVCKIDQGDVTITQN